MSNVIAPNDAPAAQQPLHVGTSIPEIYVDGYQGATYKDGVVKLNCFSVALDPATNAPQRELVLRLALSVTTIMQVHQAMGQLITDLERSGVVRRS